VIFYCLIAAVPIAAVPIAVAMLVNALRRAFVGRSGGQPHKAVVNH